MLDRAEGPRDSRGARGLEQVARRDGKSLTAQCSTKSRLTLVVYIPGVYTEDMENMTITAESLAAALAATEAVPFEFDLSGGVIIAMRSREVLARAKSILGVLA